MKLYYSPGACSLAVRILIHELNLPCEFVRVDFKSRKTEHGHEYDAINAKGSVPALQLEKGDLLTENAVIHQYLADQYKANTLLPGLGDFRRYRVLEWLNFVTTELHKGCSPLFKPQIPAEVKENFFKPVLKSKLSIVDKHLAKQQYLMGDHYCLADGYLFVILTWLPKLGVELLEFPSLQRFFDELKQRPSVHKSLQEEGLI